MRRWPAILLLVAFFALGSGALEYVHNHEHLHDGTHHEQGDCFLHAQLHKPLMLVAPVPLLIAAGLFVAFLTLLTPPVISRSPVLRLDCRGPPAC